MNSASNYNNNSNTKCANDIPHSWSFKTKINHKFWTKSIIFSRSSPELIYLYMYIVYCNHWIKFDLFVFPSVLFFFPFAPFQVLNGTKSSVYCFFFFFSLLHVNQPVSNNNHICGQKKIHNLKFITSTLKSVSSNFAFWKFRKNLKIKIKSSLIQFYIQSVKKQQIVIHCRR